MKQKNSDSCANYCAIALAGSLAMLLGRPALADTTDDLLDSLRAKGILNQQEYLSLKQRKSLEERQAPTAQPQPAPPPSAPFGGPALAPSTPFVTMMDKGIGLHLGPVDLSVTGNINVFYVEDWPDKVQPSTTVLGGLANTGGIDTASVRNGLLPGNFSIKLTTRQEGYDIGVTFGLYPGINNVNGVGGANSTGNPRGLGTTGIDFRQQFVTVGTERMGTFKAGRDIGFFAQEAILNDFTLFGVGSPGSNIAPSNTTLGRIGLGYIYPDWIPQISYTSPIFAGGFQGAIGVFTPLASTNFSGVSGVLSGSDQPQIQAKLTYTTPAGMFGPIGAKFWANLVTQDLKSNGGTDAGGSHRAIGGDFGTKLTYGGAAAMLYGYVGDGIGTTALFFDAVSLTGATRGSYGYIGQLTYTFFDRLTIGGSYGLSHLRLANNEVNPLLVKDNESESFGVHYKLTDWVNLVAEYTHTHAKAQGGNAASEDTVAAGTIVFF